MKRGNRKYRCEECQAETYHHWVELNRAARMRCPACGSARLELCNKEAKKEQADLQAVRVTGHRDMTHPPTKPRRKVT